jgi:hypothetical protein
MGEFCFGVITRLNYEEKKFLVKVSDLGMIIRIGTEATTEKIRHGRRNEREPKWI